MTDLGLCFDVPCDCGGGTGCRGFVMRFELATFASSSNRVI